jgi:DNA helicase II / ATP-dependent DNA helicase PcrA
MAAVKWWTHWKEPFFMSQDYLDGLTPEQREAVLHRDGPLLILAGAGSGKTRVVTRRIAHMVNDGVPPNSILAITFTNKAAGEMRDRVASLLPNLGDDRPVIRTFHAFAVRVLRRYTKRIGFPGGFAILDASDHLALIRQAAVSARVDVQKYRAHDLAQRVGRVKELLDDEGFCARATSDIDRAVAKTLPVYRELQRLRGAMDFEDLVAETVRLLEAHEDVREFMTETLRYVMVDEYQDTNHAQYRLANLLAGDRKNLAVVGDPDQSIYGWRGADMGNILRFEEDYPETKVILLEHNYRSTATILEASNALISKNVIRKDKQLLATGDKGRPIDVCPCSDADMEADYVARRIKRLIEQDGVIPSEIAIAYRGKAHAPRYEEALLRHGVPAAVAGSISFFDRREIKDALAFVRLAVNSRDDLAALRALRVRTQGVGKKSLEKLYELQRSKGLSIVEACEQAASVSGLTPRKRATLEEFAKAVRDLEVAAKGGVEEAVNAAIVSGGLLSEPDENDPHAEIREDNLRKLVQAARKADGRAGGCGKTRDFLDRLALIDSQDRGDDPADERIVMTTIHAAKGLEFDVVFCVGMEDGLFPHYRSVEEGKVEEERRLAYVAFTRARKLLVLTYASQRAARSASRVRRLPSMFLYELPPELLWDPQLREQMELPDREAALEAQKPKPKAVIVREPSKEKKLIGVTAGASKGKPLWARGLLG